jgi:hypothetical protein
LRNIDEEYISDFESNNEYFIVKTRPPIKKVEEPYIYESSFSMNEIEQFLCYNQTQMVFISSPYSKYFDINGELVKVPVDIIEFLLDCNIFDMKDDL